MLLYLSELDDGNMFRQVAACVSVDDYLKPCDHATKIPVRKGVDRTIRGPGMLSSTGLAYLAHRPDLNSKTSGYT